MVHPSLTCPGKGKEGKEGKEGKDCNVRSVRRVRRGKEGKEGRAMFRWRCFMRIEIACWPSPVVSSGTHEKDAQIIRSERSAPNM